ncbi:MAG: acyltransferase [Planctomycetes bacterium]|nr:acyltransferase [Planctomycetota bacterium]
MKSSFYTPAELKKLAFKTIGKDVLISRYARIYSMKDIEIGSNVRIDDFCLLSGKIKIGSHVHISAYASLCGGEKWITLDDFVNVSQKVEIYAKTDDFSGATLTNPTIPDKFKNLVEADVILKKHVLVGVGSVVLPGVTLEEGSVIGALSLVKNSTSPWSINVGIPAKKIKDRQKDLLKLENLFLDEYNKRQ